MPITFQIRRAYDRGFPVGAAKTHMSTRGTFTVGEQHDEQCKRQVMTAQFAPLAGQEPMPLLREARLLSWNGTVMSLTGIEEIADSNLGRPQRLQQTWLAEPEDYAELRRVEALLGRVVNRLREVGVAVDMLPGGRMRIAGERRPDDGELVESA